MDRNKQKKKATCIDIRKYYLSCFNKQKTIFFDNTQQQKYLLSQSLSLSLSVCFSQYLCRFLYLCISSANTYARTRTRIGTHTCTYVYIYTYVVMHILMYITSHQCVYPYKYACVWCVCLPGIVIISLDKYISMDTLDFILFLFLWISFIYLFIVTFCFISFPFFCKMQYVVFFSLDLYKFKIYNRFNENPTNYLQLFAKYDRWLFLKKKKKNFWKNFFQGARYTVLHNHEEVTVCSNFNVFLIERRKGPLVFNLGKE